VSRILAYWRTIWVSWWKRVKWILPCSLLRSSFVPQLVTCRRQTLRVYLLASSETALIWVQPTDRLIMWHSAASDLCQYCPLDLAINWACGIAVRDKPSHSHNTTQTRSSESLDAQSSLSPPHFGQKPVTRVSNTLWREKIPPTRSASSSVNCKHRSRIRWRCSSFRSL
jgi:hypothetical protein